MRKFLYLFLIFCAFLSANEAYIVSDFTISDIPCIYRYGREEGFEITEKPSKYDLRTFYPNKNDKVLVWNSLLSSELPLFTSTEKKPVFFLWEPRILDQSYYKLFSRVYTWSDDLVDGKFFFKFYYPFLMPMIKELTPFAKKKLCVMVASNHTPERVQMIRFFEQKPTGEFDLYGASKYSSKNYRGSIPGGHSGESKINVLKNYRFCICFENTMLCKGYISEKIFGCFAAGCVPIFLGTSNIEKYIPKNCFIDYRDFSTDKELYLYLKKMSKKTYQSYLNHIRLFLDSEEAQLFSPDYFDKIIHEAVTAD